eukprot:COSAG01_NODE_751_length_13837_cov_78.727981_14_plen_38_part_00
MLVAEPLELLLHPRVQLRVNSGAYVRAGCMPSHIIIV